MGQDAVRGRRLPQKEDGVHQPSHVGRFGHVGRLGVVGIETRIARLEATEYVVESCRPVDGPLGDRILLGLFGRKRRHGGTHGGSVVL